MLKRIRSGRAGRARGNRAPWERAATVTPLADGCVNRLITLALKLVCGLYRLNCWLRLFSPHICILPLGPHSSLSRMLHQPVHKGFLVPRV